MKNNTFLHAIIFFIFTALCVNASGQAVMQKGGYNPPSGAHTDPWTTNAPPTDIKAPSGEYAKPHGVPLQQGTNNYASFSEVKHVKSNEAARANAGYEHHPEAGMLFPGAPCDDCYELIGERTEISKSFVREGLHNGKQQKLTQTSTQPMHYKDAQGNWRTIVTQLKSVSNKQGIYSIENEAIPVFINTNATENFSALGKNDDRIKFNHNLELIFVQPDGREVSLGKADYSHHTAGDNGIYATNAWDGIDIEMSIMRGAIKTNFHLNKALPQYAAGKLKIRDYMKFGNGWKFNTGSQTIVTGDLQIIDGNGVLKYMVGGADIYEKGNLKSTVQPLSYELVPGSTTVDIAVPGDYLNKPEASYPIIIDPLVTQSTTSPAPLLYGSEYITVLTPTSGCLYPNAAFTPLNCTVTDIQFQFQYSTSVADGVGMEYGGSFFYLGPCRSPGTLAGGLVWSCLTPLAGTCTATGGVTYSLFSDLSPCLPPPSCPSIALNINMYLFQSWLPTAAMCATRYLWGSQPLIITVLGETVAVNPITVAPSTTICLGSSVTLTALGYWGVPPYTYSWTPGGMIGTPITVTPAATTTYAVTVTDACGITATTNVTITVDPISPITGITTLCAGTTSLLTDATPGGTWTSSNTAVATITRGGGLVTAIAPGTTTITYTAPGGCTATIVVTVTAAPGPITGTLTMCVGATSALGCAPAGGTWSSGTTAVATISAGGVVTGVSAGTSTIVYSIGGCTSSVVVTVDPIPAPITGVTTLCSGTTSLLTDAVGGGTWTSSNTAVATISATGLVTAIAPGTTTITYTLPGGCFVTTVVTVTASPLPITGTLTVCVGSTTILNDASAGGTWTSGTTTVATISGTGVVTGVSAGTSTIVYSLGAGCTTSAVVTVDPMPAAITGTTTLCEGTTSLLSDAVAGGTWTSSNTAVATISATGLVTAIAVGTTTITYTLPGGCFVTIVVTVTATPLPIAGTLTVCVGSTTNLTDPSAGGTWTSGTTTVATISGTGVVTGISAGTSTIVYSLGAGCNVSVVVTVDPIPAAITGITTLCAGTTSLLSDAVAGGTWTSSNTAVATISATGLVSAIAPGTTTITYTLPGGCSISVVVTVTGMPAPITGTPTVCVGSTINLSDAVSGGTWTSGTPAVATISGTGVVTGISAGTSTIVYSLGAGCTSSTVVTVLPTPVISGISFINPTTCTSSDGNITISGLTAGTVYTLNYTFGGTPVTTTATANATGNIVISPLAAGTYSTIYVTSAAGCVSNVVGPVTLVQPAAPPAPVPNDVTYCQFQPAVALTATGTGGTLTWYTTATGGTGSATAPIPPTNVAGTFFYYVSQVMLPCESPRAMLTVTIIAKPAIPTVFPPTYCQNASPVAALSVTPAIGLTWYGPGTTAGYATTPTPIVTAAGTFDYYVTQTVSGCTSDSALDPVTVIPQPVPPAVNDTSYCISTLNVPALNATGTDLLWYASASLVTSIPDPVPPTTTIGTTSWYVTQTVDGCTSLPATLNVTIYSAPQFTVNATRAFVCQNDTITLQYTNFNPGTYSLIWTLPSGDTFYSGNSSATQIVVNCDSVYKNNIILTVSSGGSCVSSDTVHMNVIPMPWAYAYLQPYICVHDTTTIALSKMSQNASNFVWNFGDAIITAANINSGGPYGLTWSDTGIHIISLTSETPEGCMGKTTYDTTDVLGPPDARFNYVSAHNPICTWDSVEFQTYIYDSKNYYTWTPAEYFHNSNLPVAWGNVLNSGNIYLSVRDPYGCMGYDSMNVSVEQCCQMFVPSAFTPATINGDLAKCSHFGPLFQYNAYHRYHIFEITNRWGQVVFETTETDKEWDGTFNGVPQEVGVYYWYIEYECGGIGTTQKAHGDVTLIR